jgi:hypothetical protein
MKPMFKITRVNLRPLLPEGALDLDTERVLKRLQREVLKQLRSKIVQETFSARAKRALLDAIKIVIGPNSLTITSSHPAFKTLLGGQQAGQMTWLTKARAPIPIITEEGELIFRSATPQSMADGSWQHPGRQKSTVLERAKAEARSLIKERLQKELVKQLRKSAGHR